MVLSLVVEGSPSTRELLAIGCREEIPVSDMLRVAIAVAWTFLRAGFGVAFDTFVSISNNFGHPMMFQVFDAKEQR